MTIEPIRFAALLKKTGLLAEYAAECSIPEIGPINPQADLYARMEDNGMMDCFAALYEGEIVGFATVLTPILPHYGKKVGIVESLFVGSAHRKYGLGRLLMRRLEVFAGCVGCVGIQYIAPVGSQLEKLLETSKHYRRTNAVFYKEMP